MKEPHARGHKGANLVREDQLADKMPRFPPIRLLSPMKSP